MPDKESLPSQNSPPRLGWPRTRAPLPIHFKIIQASRKILEAVDLFVALATVKLKSFICENAVQFDSERIGAREITRVMSAAQNAQAAAAAVASTSSGYLKVGGTFGGRYEI